MKTVALTALVLALGLAACESKTADAVENTEVANAVEADAAALDNSVDNGLDAAEAAGVAPEIAIAVEEADSELRIAVSDNSLGLASAKVARILDFTTRTSDKAALRRGAHRATPSRLSWGFQPPWAAARRL